MSADLATTDAQNDSGGAVSDEPPAIEMAGVTYRYGDHVAVDDLDLSVMRGECFGLLGPNGAGKTTTIGLLNTLLRLQSGSIRVLGVDVRRDAMAVRRLLGYVPQKLSVEGALTGRQNVSLFARLFALPRQGRQERVREVLAHVDLTESADRLASTYSGGMLRRLELAQALVSAPALLILDEPTVGLDPVARDSVWARLSEVRSERGMTILLTTHYMDEADALCDRVAMLHRGRLRAVGRPRDLKASISPQASLDDVFRHYTGDSLSGEERGGLRDVRSTRRAE